MDILRKKITAVGLDIGSSRVKAVRMTKKGKLPYLENFAIEPIEQGVIQSGEIREPALLADAARKAVKRLGTNLRDVAVALPNFAILSEMLTMKLTPEKQMRQAVLHEAERISPFELDEIEIDYAVLDRNEEDGSMKVLMVAAKHDIILSYIDFLSEAGLRPMLMDVDLFSLANVFHLNYDGEQYQSSILLNIGTESTVAAFIQNGKFHSSRDISVAGDTFLRELDTLPDMDQEKIHDLLRGIIPEDYDAEMVAGKLLKPMRDFANAVGVAVSYFQASDNVDTVDEIVLTGGYAWIPGLINALELRTGAGVTVLDPFRNIGYDETVITGGEPIRMGAVLAVALGLASRLL